MRDPRTAALLAALGAASCTTIISFPDYQASETSTSSGGEGGTTSASGGNGGATSTSAGGHTATGGGGAGGNGGTTGAGGAGGSGGHTGGAGGSGGTTTTGADGSGGTTTIGAGGSGGAGGGLPGACQWAARYGEPKAKTQAEYQNSGRIAATADGSGVIITGKFQQQIDLGLDPPLTPNQAALFVAQVDGSGTTTWRQLFVFTGSADATALAVDKDGAYVGGTFDGSLTIGKTLLKAAGTKSVFLSKLDSSGTVLWAKSWMPALGQAPSAAASAAGAATDGAGNVYLAGVFHGELDFGQGKLDSATADGGPTDKDDVFVAKVDTGSGAASKSASFGDAEIQWVETIAVDKGGNAYLAGELTGSMSFGNNVIATSSGGIDKSDAWIAKLDPNLVGLWANTYGDGTNSNSIQSVAVDDNGGVFLLGDFSGSMSLGNLTLDTPARALFVAKLQQSDGSGIAASRFQGGVSMAHTFLATNGANTVYVTGAFPYWLYLGPGLHSAGNNDVFAARLDMAGNAFDVTWSKRFGDLASQKSTGVAVAGGRVLVLGDFFQTIDLGCGTLITTNYDANKPATWATDVFLAALGP